MLVYVAGPYSKGDMAVNVHNAIQVANKILELGHIPYLPHLTHFWHLVTPKPYQTWLEIDRSILIRCDCVFRMSGDSQGADGEVILAGQLGLPVYYSLEDLPNVLGT